MKKQAAFRHLRPILEALEARNPPTDLGASALASRLAAGAAAAERLPLTVGPRSGNWDNGGGNYRFLRGSRA